MPDNITATTVVPNDQGSIIQSPALDKAGKPTQRSIRDAGMARDVIKTVMAAGRTRAIVNSRILSKYNAERPYNAQRLEAEGLGWRTNFTSKPLPSMIEKVGPRFVSAVDSLKYFTDSALPASRPNATLKTSKFRAGVTKTIRARREWRTLVDDIAFENALFGHVIVAWLDEFCWFPRFFHQDESFVSDGTKSEPSKAQVVVLKEVYLPHELFAYIKDDSEAAKEAGWNLENTKTAINNASSAQLRDRLNVGGTLETWYQNAIRELSIGASYMAGVSVIVVYTLLASEVTGKVSHYRLAGTEMLNVFERDDRFPSMEDALAFFSFQKGNGTLHGSKGVGRDIYEMAGMQDRIRNEVVDRLILSGKTMIQGDAKRLNTFKMSVVGSSVIIPSGWDVLQQKLDGNVEGFLKLDAYFDQLVSQLIGSTTIPQQGGGEGMRSPAAWNVLMTRQEEGQDMRIGRFMVQFTSLIQTMQRRLCNPDTDEDDAKAFQKEMLEIMSREELDEIANQPVAGSIKDLTPVERQMIAIVAGEKKGNPLYNQKALETEDLCARVSAEFADQVLLPDQDPTETAEQNRFQRLEIVLLSQGESVPVSPRDNHLIHLQVLMPAAEQLAQQLQSGQFPTPVLEAFLAHINEHYNQAVAQGVPKEQLAEVADFVKKIGPALAQLKQVDAQAAQVAQASAEHNQGGAPGNVVPMPSGPPPQ